MNHIYTQSVAIKIASGQKPRACPQQARVVRKNSLWAGRNPQQDQAHMGTDSSTVAADLQGTGLHLLPLQSPSLACPSAGSGSGECFWDDWQAFTSTVTEAAVNGECRTKKLTCTQTEISTVIRRRKSFLSQIIMALSNTPQSGMTPLLQPCDFFVTHAWLSKYSPYSFH